MKFFVRFFILGLLAMPAVSLAMAGSFEEGVTAYDAGDYKRAHDLWLEQVAKDENPAALRNLGHLYRRGLGVARDAEKARDYYEEAARQGLAGAQANLGRMYLRGDGIPQDYEKAHHWLTQAARNNHVSARYRLATMYDYGLGRPANAEAALLWYGLAGKAGHKAALDRLVTLVALMPPPQLADLPAMGADAGPRIATAESAAVQDTAAEAVPDAPAATSQAPEPPAEGPLQESVEEPTVKPVEGVTEAPAAEAPPPTPAPEPALKLEQDRPALFALDAEDETKEPAPEAEAAEEAAEEASGWFRLETPTLKKRR